MSISAWAFGKPTPSFRRPIDQVVVHAADRPVRLAPRERRPELRAPGKVELRRHHADHRVASAVELEFPADGVGGAPEMALPEVMAHDDDLVLPGIVLSGRERAAHRRPGPHHGEEVGRDHGRPGVASGAPRPVRLSEVVA